MVEQPANVHTVVNSTKHLPMDKVKPLSKTKVMFKDQEQLLHLQHPIYLP